MSTHYCEIHASGRIYNPPLLILRSATPLVLRPAIFWLCMLRPFPNLRAPVFSVLQSMLLPVLRSLILSVCVSSFCDFTILILRFRLLRFCGFEFQSADSDSSRFCRLQPFRTAVTILREPALLQRYDIRSHVQMFHVKHFPLAPAARSDQRVSVTYKRSSPPNMPPRRWKERV